MSDRAPVPPIMDAQHGSSQENHAELPRSAGPETAEGVEVGSIHLRLRMTGLTNGGPGPWRGFRTRTRWGGFY